MKTPRRPIRNLLSRLSLVLVAMVGLMALQACSAGATPGQLLPDLTGSSVDTQTLRLAGPIGLDGLDPATSKDLGSVFILRQVFRGLTELDADLQPIPSLAETIDISDDGLTYTFTLRPDAVFQDGRPVAASDVVYSLTRAMDPATTGGEAALLAGPTFLSDIAGSGALLAGEADQLSGVQALDDHTVQVTLSEPRSTFLMKLASGPGMIVDPLDVARGADWWQAPNGSGPFEMTEFVDGDHLVLERSEFTSPGSDGIRRVEMRLGANAMNALNLYEAGEIDVAGVDASGIDRAMSPESPLADEVVQTPLFAVDYIAFRTDVAPMDDPKIREAVWLAFPRDKMANVSLNGWAEPAQGLVPDGMLGVPEWTVDAPAFEVEAAKQAIADSSYGDAANVPPIQIAIAGYGGATALRDSLEANLGLQVEVVDVEWGSFVDGLSRHQYQAYELYWGADYPDPEALLLILFGSGRPDNYIDYENAAFNDLLDRAARETDPDARAAIYAEANQVLADDLAIMPLYYPVEYTVVKPYVTNLELTPLGILYLDDVRIEEQGG